MKTLFRLTLLIFFLAPNLLQGQTNPPLICPLNDATVVPPPKNQIHYDETDLCIVLVSTPDTVVKAIGVGRITNTEYTDDGQYGLVLFTRVNGKEYYCWFTGMNKLLVKRNDAVRAGQPIGYVSSGQKIELTMYEFETPVDPLKFLPCKGVLRGF
jgi:hypothetical protein